MAKDFLALIEEMQETYGCDYDTAANEALYILDPDAYMDAMDDEEGGKAYDSI